MITVDGDVSSENIAMWYRDIPIKPEVLRTLKDKITKECWKYLIGKMCLTEKSNRGDAESIHGVYERIGHDFGYAYPSLKEFVHYANSIDHIQKILPDIASDILNGKIHVSLKATVILAKMAPPEIRNIFERLACC